METVLQYDYTNGVDFNFSAATTATSRFAPSSLSFLLQDPSGNQENAVFLRPNSRTLTLHLTDAFGDISNGGMVLDLSGGVVSSGIGNLQFVFADSLSAGSISADTLSVASAYINSISAAAGYVSNLSAGTAGMTSLSASNLSAGVGLVHTLTITTGVATSFVTGTLSAINGNIDTISVGNLSSANANITTLSAGVGHIANLSSANANIDTLSAGVGHIANLSSTNANITTLSSGVGHIANLSAMNVNVDALSAGVGYIHDTVANTLSVSIVSAVTINVSHLSADTVSANTAYITTLSGINVDVSGVYTNDVILTGGDTLTGFSTLLNSLSVAVGDSDLAELQGVSTAVVNLEATSTAFGDVTLFELAASLDGDISALGYIKEGTVITDIALYGLISSTNQLVSHDASNNVGFLVLSSISDAIVSIRAFDNSGSDFDTPFMSLTNDLGSTYPHFVLGPPGISTILHALDVTNPLYNTSTSMYVIGDLEVDGGVSAHGYFTTSDARLKRDVEPLSNALGAIRAMRGVSYNWRDGRKSINPGHKEIGLIAQEVEAVLPNLVHTAASGQKAVAYDRIVSLLIDAVKELADRIDA